MKEKKPRFWAILKGTNLDGYPYVVGVNIGGKATDEYKAHMATRVKCAIEGKRLPRRRLPGQKKDDGPA